MNRTPIVECNNDHVEHEEIVVEEFVTDDHIIDIYSDDNQQQSSSDTNNIIEQSSKLVIADYYLPDILPDGSFRCRICGAVQKTRNAFKCHRHRTHGAIKNTLLCPADNGCKIKVPSISSLKRHLTIDHGIELNDCELHFANEVEFKTWLIELEESTHSRYICQNGRRADGRAQRQVMYCHRSGPNKTRYNTKTGIKQKRRGTSKIGTCCPAHITVAFQKNGSIDVLCQLTHYGHECDPKLIQVRRDEIVETIHQSSDQIDVANQEIIVAMSSSESGNCLNCWQTFVVIADVYYDHESMVINDSSHYYSAIDRKRRKIINYPIESESTIRVAQLDEFIQSLDHVKMTLNNINVNRWTQNEWREFDAKRLDTMDMIGEMLQSIDQISKYQQQQRLQVTTTQRCDDDVNPSSSQKSSKISIDSYSLRSKTRDSSSHRLVSNNVCIECNCRFGIRQQFRICKYCSSSVHIRCQHRCI